MPREPFRVSSVCSWPNWSRAENAGAFCPTAKANRSEQLEGGDVNGVAVKRAVDGYAVSQMPAALSCGSRAKFAGSYRHTKPALLLAFPPYTWPPRQRLRQRCSRC